MHALRTTEEAYRSKVLRNQQLLTITQQIRPPQSRHSAVHLLLRLYFRQSLLWNHSAGDCVEGKMFRVACKGMSRDAQVMAAGMK